MLFKRRKIRVKDLIDGKNNELYDFVSHSLNLSVAETSEPNGLIFTKGNNAIIYIPKGKVSSSAFTHELLHAELKIKGVHFSTKLSVSERPSLIPFFSDELSDHITNILEHRKMYPKFISMGYNENEFLSDSLIPILTPLEANSLAGIIKDSTGRYYPQGINMFIGKYIAAIGTCLPFFNYEKELQILRDSEPKLTSILDNLLARWDKYDIEKEGDLSEDSYHLISYEFTQEIEDWVKSIEM